MIGSSCKLFKICKICDELKCYREFHSKGRGKRVSYCKGCKVRRNEIKLPSIQYKFDVGQLNVSDNIEVRIKLPSDKRIRYKVSYEDAKLLVKEGMAGIVHETLIHKFYDRQSFKKKILERDNHTCIYCKEFGNTVDHIIPKSKGGISSFFNCVCACRSCNRNKGNLSLSEFLYYIEPLKITENKSNIKIAQQLDYTSQILQSINVNNIDLDEQKQVNSTIKQIENLLDTIKTNIKCMELQGGNV